MRSALLAAAALGAAAQQNVSDVILPGPALPNQMAFIFIQGADIPPVQYVPFLQSVQNGMTFYDTSVWVGAPGFLLDVPEPLEIGGAIKRVWNALVAGGLNPNAPVFYASHSLGGTMLQLYLAADPAAANNNTLGVGLFGSFLNRWWRGEPYASWPPTQPFPWPTISVVGELDGLARVTRFADALWYNSQAPGGLEQFPVIVIPGMNHGQWASGDMPAFVQFFDLASEANTTDAQGQAAHVVSLFIAQCAGSASAGVELSGIQQASTGFLQPLVDAMTQESYYFFKGPCYDGPIGDNCTVGSPWSETSQAFMSSAIGPNASLPATIADVDALHEVSDINPVHLPTIKNNCSAGATPATCHLNSASVTENVYGALNADFDPGLFPVTAQEQRAKMSSRQASFIAAGVPGAGTDAFFNQTDGLVNTCADFNQYTFETALNTWAAPATRARFLAKGTPFTYEPDQDALFGAGPAWIYCPLVFAPANSSASPTGVAVSLTSWTIRTPADFWLPVSALFHYCKNLSPAFAMEWIYVDGLRSLEAMQLMLPGSGCPDTSNTTAVESARTLESQERWDTVLEHLPAAYRDVYSHIGEVRRSLRSLL